LEVRIAIESSGKFRTREKATLHKEAKQQSGMPDKPMLTEDEIRNALTKFIAFVMVVQATR
jgi:hypothetical protein